MFGVILDYKLENSSSGLAESLVLVGSWEPLVCYHFVSTLSKASASVNPQQPTLLSAFLCSRVILKKLLTCVSLGLSVNSPLHVESMVDAAFPLHRRQFPLASQHLPRRKASSYLLRGEAQQPLAQRPFKPCRQWVWREKMLLKSCGLWYWMESLPSCCSCLGCANICPVEIMFVTEY